MARVRRTCPNPDCNKQSYTEGPKCQWCGAEMTPQEDTNIENNNKEEELEMKENNRSWILPTIVAIVAIVVIIALLIWCPWFKNTSKTEVTENPNGLPTVTIDKNVKITGDLEVEGNATIKGQLTAAVIVSETDILAKRNIVAEETVQGKVVQATEKVIAPEVHTNKVVTQSVETTNNQVVVQPKSEGSIVNNVVEQPAQQPVVRQQQVVRQQSSTQGSSTFRSGDPQWNTGEGLTKTVTLVVAANKSAVVGGYLVNNVQGSLKIYGPGTYTLTICSGFIRDNVDPSNAQSTLQMKHDEAVRLGQDVSNSAAN